MSNRERKEAVEFVLEGFSRLGITASGSEQRGTGLGWSRS